MSEKSRQQFISFFAALVAGALVSLATPNNYIQVGTAAAVFLGVAGLGLGNTLLSGNKFSIVIVAILIVCSVAFTRTSSFGFSGPPIPPDHRIHNAMDDDGNLLPLEPVPAPPTPDPTLSMICIAALVVVAAFGLARAKVPLHLVFTAFIAEIVVLFLVLFLIGNFAMHVFRMQVEFSYFYLPSILIALATYVALRAGSRVMQAKNS